MSLIGDSLLVYCQDNTLYHFLVVPAMENGTYQSLPRLVQFGQINFRGIIHSPTRVRAISWILPEEHSRISKIGYCPDVLGMGDPSEDAAVATVVFLLDGKLVLLRRSARTEVPATDLKYDMRVLSDKIEFFLFLVGHGDESPMPALKGSIWAWDGKHFKVGSVSSLD